MKTLYTKFRALPTVTQCVLIAAVTAIIIVAMVTEHTAILRAAAVMIGLTP